MRDERPKEFKVVLLGDAGVGKSSLAVRFCQQTFRENYSVTIGGAYLSKMVDLHNGRKVKLHFWDTGGSERYRAMAPQYYRDASAAVLVFDVTDRKSLKGIDYWVKELDDKVRRDGLVLFLAASKCDLEPHAVSGEEARKLAKAHEMRYAETSAKTGAGVEELFRQIATDLAQRR